MPRPARPLLMSYNQVLLGTQRTDTDVYREPGGSNHAKNVQRREPRWIMVVEEEIVEVAEGESA